MRSSSKILSVIVIFIVGLSISPAFSAIKPGSACKKIGQVQNYSGKKYTCIKSGSKLLWSKGVVINSKEAEAKAAAELKAKQEAEAKAAAELKAKQEAEAKAAAELKAKQEAEALLEASRTQEINSFSEFMKLYVPFKERQTDLKRDKEKDALNDIRLALEKTQKDLDGELVVLLNKKTVANKTISEINQSIAAQDLTIGQLQSQVSSTNSSITVLKAAADNAYTTYSNAVAVTNSYSYAASRAESENASMLAAKVLCDFGFGSCDLYNPVIYNLNAATIRTRNSAKAISDSAYSAYSAAFARYKTALDSVASLNNQIAQFANSKLKLTADLSSNKTTLQTLLASENELRSKLDSNLILRNFNIDQGNKLLQFIKDLSSQSLLLEEAESTFSVKWLELSKDIENNKITGITAEFWSKAIAQLITLKDTLNGYNVGIEKLVKAIEAIPAEDIQSSKLNTGNYLRTDISEIRISDLRSLLSNNQIQFLFTHMDDKSQAKNYELGIAYLLMPDSDYTKISNFSSFTVISTQLSTETASLKVSYLAIREYLASLKLPETPKAVLFSVRGTNDSYKSKWSNAIYLLESKFL